MTDASRRVYLGLGRAFVAIGGVVALASVLDRALGWGFFRGSPVGTAAVLFVIGALLLWTVRQADAGPAPAPAGPADDADEVAADDADEDADAVAAGNPGSEPLDPGPERP